MVKRNLAPTELACWRALDGCVGVPRVFSLGKGKNMMALSPDGTQSITMQAWFGGHDGRLRQGERQSMEWARKIVARLYAVVRQMHTRGVIHADLHPGNVVLDRTSESTMPIVIDFGLATLFLDDKTDECTPLTHMEVTLSVRGTREAQSTPRPRTWCPQPHDDLESVALLGEWLVGNLVHGHSTTPEDKARLLANGRARKRWGIDLPHLDNTVGGFSINSSSVKKADVGVRRPLAVQNK